MIERYAAALSRWSDDSLCSACSQLMVAVVPYAYFGIFTGRRWLTVAAAAVSGVLFLCACLRGIMIAARKWQRREIPEMERTVSQLLSLPYPVSMIALLGMAADGGGHESVYTSTLWFALLLTVMAIAAGVSRWVQQRRQTVQD